MAIGILGFQIEEYDFLWSLVFEGKVGEEFLCQLRGGNCYSSLNQAI